MDRTEIALVVVLALTILAAAYLAAAEASLLRVSEFRVRSLVKDGNRRAVRLEAVLGRLPAVLNMILFLALLAQIGAATITGFLAESLFGNLGVTIASVVLTVVLFVYGEAIPKTYAIRHAERVALRIASPMSALERALRPLVSSLVWIADIQLPGKGVRSSPTVTEGELRLMAGRAAHEGAITEHDLVLIERAFRFGDRRVAETMVPRPDIVAIGADAGLEAAIKTALHAGHRRLPVYAGDLDRVVGVVGLRDLIEARDKGDIRLSDLLSVPLSIPEWKKVGAVLEDMQEEATHMAIVVDEYGATAGLVTIEDVAEELLGTISEPQAPGIERTDEGGWLVAGSLPVEDLAQTGMTIPAGDWNTAAGLMVGLAGRLLGVGDAVVVGDVRLTVESVARHRITRITVERAESD